MWNRIFNPENIIFQVTDRLFNIVLLSVLWLFLCIPVVTAGPATAALYYALVKCIRRREPMPFKNYFQSFRANFKDGLLTGLICLVAGQILAMGFFLLLPSVLAGTKRGMLVFGVYCVFLLLVMGIMAYLFPLLSRYAMGTGRLFGTAVRLGLKHLPSTLLLAVLMVLGVVLCIEFWILLPVMPSLVGLLASGPLERIFKRYTAAEAEGEREEEAEDGEREKPWYLR